MVALLSLWMPIVVAAVLVFVVSAIVHMALGYHKADYKKLPDEDGTLAALRASSIRPGYYVFPHCMDPKEAQTPAMQEKFRGGPVGMLTVVPSGPPNMGKLLGLWFVYTLLVSLFAGYVASRTLGATADYLAVFRVAGAAAFMSYALAPFAESIWKGQPWGNTVRAMIDGLVYALVTGGAFGWLWPR